VYFEVGRFLQATQAVKIKFIQLDFWKKFTTRIFKNQVQMDRVFFSWDIADSSKIHYKANRNCNSISDRKADDFR
jgi:hypothetical protein